MRTDKELDEIQQKRQDEITKWVIDDIEEEGINVHYVWTVIYDEAGPPRIIASDE